MNIELKGKNVNYEIKGSGDAMLFVHGWGGNSKSMDGLYEHFSKKYRCYRIDLPGFGKSDNPDSDWGVDEYGDLVKSFVEEVVKSKVIYCGHSFGGSLGIYLSAKANLIEKLILLAPAFRRRAKVKTSFSKKSSLYSSLKPLLLPFRKLAYRIVYPESQVLKYPHLEENFKKLMTQTLVPILKDVKTKTLILWGTDDSFVSIEDGYFLEKRLKNSELKVYNGVDHDLPFVRVDDVVNDITCFLNEK